MKNKFPRIGIIVLFAAIFSIAAAQEKLPASFTKKVVIEEYTGTWCGYCPDGVTRLRKLLTQYPDRVFVAAYHDGDEMEAPGGLEVANSLGGLEGVPSAAVNRMAYEGTTLVNRGYWVYLAELLLSGKPNSVLKQNGLEANATAGIRLDTKVTTGKAEITAYFGFLNKSEEPLAITVLILEDGIKGYPQSNFFNTTEGSEWKGKGQKMTDFVHDHVVRKIVTAVPGDPLTGAELATGKVNSRTWTLTLDPSWKAENLHVLVFIHSAGGANGKRAILNAQSVKLGKNQGWD